MLYYDDFNREEEILTEVMESQDKPWEILQKYLESRNGTPVYENIHDNEIFESIVSAGTFRVTMWHGELKWEFYAPGFGAVHATDVEKFNLSTEYPLDSGVSLQASYKLEAKWFIEPNRTILENLKKILGDVFMENLVAAICSN